MYQLYVSMNLGLLWHHKTWKTRNKKKKGKRYKHCHIHDPVLSSMINFIINIFILSYLKIQTLVMQLSYKWEIESQIHSVIFLLLFIQYLKKKQTEKQPCSSKSKYCDFQLGHITSLFTLQKPTPKIFILILYPILKEAI